MKKTVLLCIAALAFSCSQPDAAPTQQMQPQTKLPTGITYSDGKTIDLRYDSNNRLEKINQYYQDNDEAIYYTLTYDGNDRLVGIDKVTDFTEAASNFETTIGFVYDESGRLLSWINDEMEILPISYEEGIYGVSIGGDISPNSPHYSFNDLFDITMFSNGNPFYYSYDDTKNGAFKNVVGNYQLFMFISGDLMPFGKKPVVGVDFWSPDRSYTYTNNYDDEEYLTDFTALRGDGTHFSAEVTYNQ
jgi:hypothetical protein